MIPAHPRHRVRADQDDLRDPGELRGLLHDVGHGLATVALLLEAARGRVAPAFGSRLLELVEAENSRLLATVHNGLRGTGPGEAVAVRPVLEQIVALAGYSRPTSVTLTAGPDAALRVDPAVLWRVVGNLVDNAVRAAGPGGHVAVTLGCTDEAPVVVDVVDDGPGFRQGPAGVAHLGLEVVTRLLAGCGGRLEITDATPRGTCARVVLTGERPSRPVPPPLPEGVDRGRPGPL